MSCPFNKKKFLFIIWYGEHEMEYHNIHQESNSSNWRLTEHCKKCKEWHWKTYSHSYLIELGLINSDGEKIISDAKGGSDGCG